jgi:lysophospholipase L1-like esterase
MRIILLSIVFSLVAEAFSQPIRINEPVRFLALGDSYTIGQSVESNERWPNQFVDELVNLGYNVKELRIIAQTGWTTSSLQNAINQQMPIEGYNLISLLIGVNNQFFGGNVQTYTPQFQTLLQQAIALAGGNPSNVFVLSIPDYAYTPFGNGNPSISAGIDAFNDANRFLASIYQVRYVDITPISRNGLLMPELVASDGLHPSGLMYRLWVEEIVQYVENELNISEEAHILPLVFLSGDQLMVGPGPWVQFSIYSLSGNLIRQGTLDGKPERGILLHQLPAGIYLVSLEDNQGNVFTTKFAIIG